MTREEIRTRFNLDFERDISIAKKVADTIYADLDKYLEKAMMKAKSWDAHCALQNVKDYLEAKNDITE